MSKLKELVDRGWQISITTTKQGYHISACKDRNSTVHAVSSNLDDAINNIYNDIYIGECINGL